MVNYEKDTLGSTLPHLGITSLPLGDPWWGAPTKLKNVRG